ncbi:MAG: Response regulator rcp1 [Candidatus Omnitrophica bacterium]|nr:Response regulator rcp1 [Candidatus Omnitrophota bacterium]
MSSDLRQRTVLIAQDDDDVYEMAREAVSAAGLGARTERVLDGAELLVYLLRKPPYRRAPRPDLILLDLGMPLHGGLWALEKIRSHRTLRTLPVIVWSRSTRASDVRQAYELGANAYVQRPLGASALDRSIGEILRFFLVTALIPAGKSGR